MAISIPLNGGCACDAVRYECVAEPLFTWKCHCRQCQRSTGGGGAVNVVFSKAAVKFTKGAPKEHGSIGTTGNPTYRGFCADCGSPISAKAGLFPQILGISAASLDDPSQIGLVAHIWTASAQPWDELSATLPHFETTPTEEDLHGLASR